MLFASKKLSYLSSFHFGGRVPLPLGPLPTMINMHLTFKTISGVKYPNEYIRMQLRVKVAGLETLWWCKLFLIASPTLYILLFLNRSDYRICHIYHRRRFWSSKMTCRVYSMVWMSPWMTKILSPWVTKTSSYGVILGGLHAGLTLGWACHLGWPKFVTFSDQNFLLKSVSFWVTKPPPMVGGQSVGGLVPPTSLLASSGGDQTDPWARWRGGDTLGRRSLRPPCSLRCGAASYCSWVWSEHWALRDWIISRSGKWRY